jgi:hypothetical protein
MLDCVFRSRSMTPIRNRIVEVPEEQLPYDRHETAADIAERIRKGIDVRGAARNWRAPDVIERLAAEGMAGQPLLGRRVVTVIPWDDVPPGEHRHDEIIGQRLTGEGRMMLERASQ